MRRRHWWAAAAASARTNCTPCDVEGSLRVDYDWEHREAAPVCRGGSTVECWITAARWRGLQQDDPVWQAHQ